MKKTPKDLASTPAMVALNTVVAASALTGIVTNLVTVAKATEPTYDAKFQKSTHSMSAPEMTTYTTVYTQSYPPPGQGYQYGNDDTKTSTDAF